MASIDILVSPASQNLTARSEWPVRCATCAAVFDGHAALMARVIFSKPVQEVALLVKGIASPSFAFFAFVMLTTDMMQTPSYEMFETNRDARRAALAGTRQMMHEDEFSALTGALVDAGAVPKAIMTDALEALAQKLIARARGQLASEYELYPSEIFDRVRELHRLAASLR